MQRYYPRMSLRDRIATPEGKRRYVRALFATIADRYDLITVALSYGRDRRWKRRLIDLAAPSPGARAAELATGTGDLAFALAARGADVVGVDVTPRMIELARHKREKLVARPFQGRDRGAESPALHVPGFLVGDMVALPFAGGS